MFSRLHATPSRSAFTRPKASRGRRSHSLGGFVKRGISPTLRSFGAGICLTGSGELSGSILVLPTTAVGRPRPSHEPEAAHLTPYSPSRRLDEATAAARPLHSPRST